MHKILEIENGNLKIKVCSFGAIIMDIIVPDKYGVLGDIALGYNDVSEYVKTKEYFGAIIGRVANRIDNGTFSLDSKVYNLAINETTNNNHLHGGIKAFHKQNWDMIACQGEGYKGVQLNYKSKDIEEGYPGNLDITLLYKLTDKNELIIEYTATTDKLTLCNLTQHTFFDLSAGKAKDILDNELQISSSSYTPLNKKQIPTGKIATVKNTPLDFRNEKSIRESIENNLDFYKNCNGGIDHNFIFDKAENTYKKVASLHDKNSGRYMEIFTTEVAMQVYTSNFLDGSVIGKNGKVYNKYNAICLETQHYPDSPNHENFPPITLYPKQIYKSKTCYAFSIK